MPIVHYYNTVTETTDIRTATEVVDTDGESFWINDTFYQGLGDMNVQNITYDDIDFNPAGLDEPTNLIDEINGAFPMPNTSGFAAGNAAVSTADFPILTATPVPTSTPVSIGNPTEPTITLNTLAAQAQNLFAVAMENHDFNAALNTLQFMSQIRHQMVAPSPSMW